MNWKEAAKSFGVLNWVNSRLKSNELKRDLAKLGNDYQRRSENLGFSYDADLTVEEFKRWHRAKIPGYIAGPCGSLRVFWVGSNVDQDESGFLQALQRLANVTVFHDFKGEYGMWSGEGSKFDSLAFDHIRKVNDDSLIEQVVRAKKQGGIDVLIGQMWAHRISNDALLSVKAMNIPVINISMDDRLPSNWDSKGGIRLGSAGLASGVNLVLTTAPETCLWYGVEGCPALFWPLASSAEVFSPTDSPFRDIDVLFIGNKYGARGKIVEYLKKNGVNIECYGRGWPNGHINAKEMALRSKQAKIILGVGAIGHCFNVYTLKLRDFDAPMSGALYLTQRNPDLCKLFVEGEEIECYETCREALDKINYYLKTPADRQKIAKKGHEKVLSNHTWEARLATTFIDLGLMSNSILDAGE
jgi:spore maturation protein CgeB